MNLWVNYICILFWTPHFAASSAISIQVWHSDQSLPSSSTLARHQRCCLWLRQQLDEQQVTSVSVFINLYFHLSLSSLPPPLHLHRYRSACSPFILLYNFACYFSVHISDFPVSSPLLAALSVPPSRHPHIPEVFLHQERVIIRPLSL